jgi:hypothetical protein
MHTIVGHRLLWHIRGLMAITQLKATPRDKTNLAGVFRAKGERGINQ